MTIYKALMVRAQDGERLLKQSMVELLTRRAYYQKHTMIMLTSSGKISCDHAE